MIKKILKYRLTRIIFATVYILVAAEIFLRILNPVPMLPRYIEAKPYGIRGNIGNKTYWHITPDVKVQIRTNSRGIRADYEIPYVKPSGTKRIVVLGDSFGMGYEVDLQDTFLAKTAEILNNSGIKCEIINLSSSGYSNAEELIVLKNEGFKYKPDLVLLCWHNSDLNENARSDLYSLENGKLSVKATTYLPGVKIQEFLYRHPFCRFFTDNSHLFNWLRDNAGQKTKAILDFIRIGYRSNATASDNAAKIKMHNLTIALLQEIKKECDNKNSKFMIFDIPTRRTRAEFISEFPFDKDGGTYGFNYTSSLPLFNQHKGEILYWEHGHGHFSPRGCLLSGKTISEYIIKKKLL